MLSVFNPQTSYNKLTLSFDPMLLIISVRTHPDASILNSPGKESVKWVSSHLLICYRKAL